MSAHTQAKATLVACHGCGTASFAIEGGIVWYDDSDREGRPGLSACPVCDEDFSDPSAMARR